MMHGLHVNISLGIKQLIVYGDSLIAISQANKDWDYSTEVMRKYYATVCQIEDKFEGLQFHHVERDHNVGVDYYFGIQALYKPPQPTI